MKKLLCLLLLPILLIAGCGKQSPERGVASLDDLNRALSVVSMKGGKFPPETNEIQEFLTLAGKTMPVPPPGKKLALDLQTRQYHWADAN